MSDTPKHVGVVGKSGSGKTFVCGRMVARWARPFVVFVSNRRDPSILHHIDESKAMFADVYRGAGPISSAWVHSVIAKGYRYLYITIHNLKPADAQAWLDSLVDAIEPIGNLGLFIDEAHRVCSDKHNPERLIELIRWGRACGIDIVLISQRIYDIDPDLRSVLNYAVLFQNDHPADLNELRGKFGLTAADVLEVSSLRPRQHILIDRDHSKRSPIRQI